MKVRRISGVSNKDKYILSKSEYTEKYDYEMQITVLGLTGLSAFDIL